MGASVVSAYGASAFAEALGAGVEIDGRIVDGSLTLPAQPVSRKANKKGRTSFLINQAPYVY